MKFKAFYGDRKLTVVKGRRIALESEGSAVIVDSNGNAIAALACGSWSRIEPETETGNADGDTVEG